MEDQIYIIMAKVLQGEASTAEQAELDQWLAADASHQDIYAQMKALWSEADDVQDTPTFDTGAAWNKVAARIDFQQQDVQERKGRVIAIPGWLRYSSAVAAILVVALLIWKPFNSSDIRLAAADKNLRLVLPDQSVIMLRKGSTITYPKAFGSNERRVSLTGEAFFEVTHNEQQPFIVDAQSVAVKVLGTSFDVMCSEQTADVSVATGKVQVNSKSKANEAVILTPGNKVHYEHGELTPGIMNGFEAAWKKDTLHFNGTPFATVLTAISGTKDTLVSADASLTATQLQQAITVSLPLSQPLEDMLTELCLITHCRWERRGSTYVIRTK
jgi:ferric-dicitrate binding protein FerR (iron transport regulator)